MDAAAASNVLTLAEVSKHNNSSDCWLVVSGKVYDVTRFLDEHPGGDEVLLSATGKDATTDFEDVGHSTSARSMMEEYLVGEIDTSTIPERKAYNPPKQDVYNEKKFFVKILQLLVPLLILGVAVVARIFSKSKE